MKLEPLTCLENLDRCGAGCCKSISFTIPHDSPALAIGATIKVPLVLTSDMRKYYRLHGVQCTRDSVLVRLDEFFIKDQLLTVFRRCDWLTSDLRCKAHGTKNKPLVCQALNHESAAQRRFTPILNCIYFPPATEEVRT